MALLVCCFCIFFGGGGLITLPELVPEFCVISAIIQQEVKPQLQHCASYLSEQKITHVCFCLKHNYCIAT
jgi:hypothetical protein